MARGSGRLYARNGRGRGRGRGSERGTGRGRGRGRGGTQPLRGGDRPYQRNSFHTSRIEEAEDLSEDNQLPSEQASESTDESLEEAQTASEDEAALARPSYAILLSTLKAGRSEDEPARKKRKVEASAADTNSDRLENTDAVEQVDASADDEGDPDTVLAELLETEEDNDSQSDQHDPEDETTTAKDSFEKHFASITETSLKEAISAMKDQHIKKTSLRDETRKQSKRYGSDVHLSLTIRLVQDLQLKGRLSKAAANTIEPMSDQEKDVIGEISDYRDIQYGCRTLSNISRLRDAICLHALNHIFKTRDRVLKNNARLSQQEGGDTLDLRDQGFTRPKVLFIVPTKQACVRFVESIVNISEPEQQENKSRFLDTFSQEDDETWENKPEDFRELFGGNHEEDFRVGLKFTRKTIKYFSGFYNSDIIFGSALGLMRTVTTGGGGKDKKKGHDADFLSSIEIVVVDNGAAIQMQNFQHLEYVFTQLNELPKDSHGCDFARVRHWYLDGKAKQLRQTILLTSHHTPELNSLFSQHTHNIAGLVKYTPTYAGSMLSLPPSLSGYTIPQTFLRFDSPAPQSDSDARFKYFTTTILPLILRHNTKGVLIFIPSYFDFVRLRNHLSTSNETTSLSFGSLSEYTSVRDTARSRSHFMNGRHSVLIYSERAHHHFRYRIKGVKRIVFYGVPENPVFWSEIVGLLGLNEDLGELDASSRKGGKAIVRAMFSRWDVLKLERVVGTERVGRLIGDRAGDTFEFV